jgi:hypothetical protein
MIFTERLFNGNVDEEVHKQFVRFGPGKYENRSLLKIVKPKDVLKVTCSYDLIKDLTRAIGGSFEKISVDGKLFYSGKKKEELEKKEISGTDLVKFCDECEFVLLNLEFPSGSLKVGKTLPKPGSALKKNFGKAVLPLDFSDKIIDVEFKKRLELSCTFVIEDVVIPKEYADDSEKARLFAKRKGKLVRNLIIDGSGSVVEKEFEA